MTDNKNKKDQETKWSDFVNSYSDVSTLARNRGYSRPTWAGDSQANRALGGRSENRANQQTLNERIANARTIEELRDISISAKMNQGYADIINYYKTMFHLRYTVLPVRKQGSAGGNLVQETTKMVDVVNSINIEANFPQILETGLFEGFTTIYLEKEKNGLVTYLLPNSHSSPLLRNSHGTDTVVFDLSYFDDLIQNFSGNSNKDVLTGKSEKERKNREEEQAQFIVEIMRFFPKELKKAYFLYKGLDNSGRENRSAVKGPKLINLDSRYAAIVPFSPSGAPPKINVSSAEEAYHEVTNVENLKNKAELDKIFVMQIPSDSDGNPLLTVPEARAMQQSVETFLGENANVTVITAFGKTDLHDVQKQTGEKNNAVSNAYNAQFEAAGINPQLFRADTDYALGVSLNRDASFMWDILTKIINFYNSAINELFNFGEYTCLVNLLPITFYNEVDKVNEYRRSAEYGIGKLESIIATGQKQISLLDKLDLEKEMRLDELLTPLQSSHTRSSKDQQTEVDVSIDDGDDTKEKDEEVNDEEN